MSQESINELVVVYAVLGAVVAVCLGGYALYQWIDYMIFCHKLEKYEKDKK